MSDVKAVYSKELSEQYKPRFVIVDANTGKVLDNAQGYGYKSAQNAYAAWGYKHRDKSKDKRKKAAKKWLEEHKDFFDWMEDVAFYAMKETYHGDPVTFKPSDVAKCWNRKVLNVNSHHLNYSMPGEVSVSSCFNGTSK